MALVATAAGGGGDGEVEAEEEERGVEERVGVSNSPNRAAWLPQANAPVRVARSRRPSRRAGAPARPPSARREQAA